METTLPISSYFRRHYALPQDHGSWVFLLSPLLIGLFAGGQWRLATVYFVAAAFAVFLLRQPVTIAIKAASGRRPHRDLPAAVFWIVVYALLGLLALAGLVSQGFGTLALLALPGIPVFAWHLLLVSRRAERRQLGVEIVGTGVLALAAPAGYWVATGSPDPLGWWLFLLVWLQSAASIVYAYLRLEQRALPGMPDLRQRFQMGQRALLYTSFNLLASAALSIVGILPPLLPIPYLVQWAETLHGALISPAVKVKPTSIGMRQLVVSALFSVLFILAWR